MKLDETDGLCALWSRKEWVQGLLAQGEQGLLSRTEQVAEDGNGTPTPELLSTSSHPGDE